LEVSVRRDELTALKEQKAHLVHEMRTLGRGADARANGGDWTAEDKQAFDKVADRIRGINSRVNAEATVSALSEGHGWGSSNAVLSEQLAPHTAPSSYRSFREAGKWDSQDSAEYANAYWEWFTTTNPEEIHPDLLVQMRTMSKGTPSAGGYLVPQDVSQQALAAARAAGPMQTVARRFTTDQGAQFSVPVFDPHGSAAWLAESASYMESTRRRKRR
jgi:HK97 family phage major capsid protein